MLSIINLYTKLFIFSAGDDMRWASYGLYNRDKGLNFSISLNRRQRFVNSDCFLTICYAGNYYWQLRDGTGLSEPIIMIKNDGTRFLDSSVRRTVYQYHFEDILE